MASFSNRVRYALLRSPAAKAVKAYRRLRERRGLTLRVPLARQLALSADDAALAATLDRDGFVMLSKAVDSALLAELSESSRALVDTNGDSMTADVGHVSDKAFWTRPLDRLMVEGKLPSESPFVRFALQPRVLAIIGRAMGGLPQLDYVLLTLSKHSAAPLASSQLWHRDHDDTRTIKVFVYLTDVADAEDGPFTFIPAGYSDKIGFSLKSHRPDASILDKLPQDAKQAMTAPALTVFAVETSRCLHMGSRLGEGHERLMYTATYTSYPKLMGGIGSRFALSGRETAVERAVLSP